VAIIENRYVRMGWSSFGRAAERGLIGDPSYVKRADLAMFLALRSALVTLDRVTVL
jgi:hypothetical protein